MMTLADRALALASGTIHLVRVPQVKSGQLAWDVVSQVSNIQELLVAHPHALLSYLLATCTFMPLYGRLSDAMGRRAANQTAILLTALGTLACALAPNMELLILARFVR